MQCQRVPPFPLDKDGSLFKEVTGALRSPEPMNLEQLDALFCACATLRRHIHAHPEPGFEETSTQKLLTTMLTDFVGVSAEAISTCAKTGLVVDMKGTAAPVTPNAGEPLVVALRADMDALRMTEGNSWLPYKSQNEGVAHLCGHDGHMASMICAAALINRKIAALPSNCTVRILFQPAEEGPGGARPMVDEGCMKGVDEVYGYHNWPAFRYGVMHICKGPIMGHPSGFEIIITGKGGHGSQPHLAVDPVLTAAHVIVALQSVVARNVHTKEQAVLSCTMVHGGEVMNVIPDTVTIQGTIRDLSAEVYDLMCDRVRAIVDGTCAAFGAKGECKFLAMYKVVDNHSEPVEHVRRVAQKYIGDDRISSDGVPMLGGEDFSEFLHEKPGCFFFWGGNEASLRSWAQLGAPGQRSNCMCHNTAFDFNDNLIALAGIFWVRLIEDRLRVSLYSDDELPMPTLPDNLQDDVVPGRALPEAGAAPPTQTGPISLEKKRPRRS